MAVSNYHKSIGYTQGMNFIMARLLSDFDPNASFWIFNSLLIEHGIKGLY